MTTRRKKVMTNLYNYDILQNPKYADAFFYTPMEKREKDKEFLVQTSDSVAKVIYMGESYIRGSKSYDEEVKDLEIRTTPESINNFRAPVSKSFKDRLKNSLSTGFKDLADDLDIDVELELE